MKQRMISILLAVCLLVSILPQISAEEVSIPSDAVEFNGNHYKIYDDSMTWTEAKAQCESMGGRLVTITSQKEMDFLIGMLAGAQKNCYWIGLEYLMDEGRWQMVNGTSVPYFNWAPNEPNFFNGNKENYVHLFGKRYTGGNGIKEVGDWNDVSNEGAAYANHFYALENFGYICEWGEETVASIDDLVVGFNDHYYKLYHHTETWEDAKVYCESIGGHLATITSQEENDFLYQLMKDRSVGNAYFGLSDVEEEGTWKWVTDEPLEYTNWGGSEPNSEGGNENYGMFYYKYTTGEWNDGNFGQGTAGDSFPVYFICEWDNTDNELLKDLTDSDGDGLLDVWESDGVTMEGEFVDLPAMGADPAVPDIFIEIDWMVKPSSSFLGFEVSPELSLAPSEDAMRMVYEAFEAHGIRIHIDAGPDSVDFVTGNKWGRHSGGNTIPYEKSFAVDDDDYQHWSDVVSANLSPSRLGIFKHCLFVNQYDNGSSSGIAYGIPGQFFIVANQKWVRDTGDTGIAGTFMHELGHTLGLSHGGHTDAGENDHTQYKPNYLSIMNYLFQTTGLVGTNEINYSEYDLPDLDEKALNEQEGIDPDGLTDGTNLGTKFKRGLGGLLEHKVLPVANTSVDFNGLWGIQEKTVSVDINDDGKKETLTSSNDWDHINFKGGNLGLKYHYLAGLEAPGEEYEEILQEAQLEEYLKAGVLGNEGAGALDNAGAVTVLEGVSGQNFHIRIINLTPDETTYHLSATSELFVKTVSRDVTVPGSVEELSYVDIPVALRDDLAVGNYDISAYLSYEGREDVKKTFEIAVYAPTQEEAEALLEAFENGTLDGVLPNNVIEEYEDVLDEYIADVRNPFTDVPEDSFYYESVMWAVENGITNGATETTFNPGGTCLRAQVVTFLHRAAGNPAPVTNNNPFTDVKSGDFFYQPVLWAVEKGITNGTSAATFGAYANCNRAAVVTFLWRAAGEPEPESTENPFVDVKTTDFFYKPVLWAIEEGITNGVDATHFGPATDCNRAQVVTFLYRAYN